MAISPRSNGHLRDGALDADLSLSDGTVRLDPLRPSDADAHFAGEDVELQSWLSGGVSTLEVVRAYLQTVDERWRARGPIFHFAVRVEPDRHLAGTIDVQFDQDYTRAGQVNLAYGLYPQWRRRGLATRAVNLSLQFLRDHTDAREALIRADPRNRASGDVARRAGFTLVRPAGGADPMDHYERDVELDA